MNQVRGCKRVRKRPRDAGFISNGRALVEFKSEQQTGLFLTSARQFSETGSASVHTQVFTIGASCSHIFCISTHNTIFIYIYMLYIYIQIGA